MKLLYFAAAIEALTGLVLIASPSLVAWLLLSAELTSPGEAVGRVGGFGLLALGVACWPLQSASNARAIRGILVYNVLVTAFLLYLGIRGVMVGLLLWPGAALHAILSVLLVRSLVTLKETKFPRFC